MTPTRKHSGILDSVAKKTVLSAEKKIELICRYAGGARLKSLASEYDIAYSTAHKICTDKKLKATLFGCKDNFALVKNLRVSLSPLNISEKTEYYSGVTRPCSDDAVSSEETSPKEQVHDEEVHIDSDYTVIQHEKEQGSLIESPKPLGLDKTLDSWVKSMKENCHPVTDSLLVEKARQSFVEVTGSEEGFSDSCEWLVELKSKYGLLNGRDNGKGLLLKEGKDIGNEKVIFEDKSGSKKVNVSASKCFESSDTVESSVKEEDSRDIPPNLVTSEKNRSSSSKETSDVGTGLSLSELRFVPKGQLKVKFNFHRKGVSFSSGLKMNDSKRKRAPHRIKTPGAKKNSSSKLNRINYDCVKKLASKQNLGLHTAMDIHSDKKKLEAFMSRWVVKVERESLQSLRSCMENVEGAKLPLSEIKGLENSKELETGRDNSVTGKASSSVSQSKCKSRVPKIIVKEFSVKSSFTPVDSAGSVKELDEKEHQGTGGKEHQDVDVNYFGKSAEIGQPAESKEEVKQVTLVNESPEIADTGRPVEIVPLVKVSKKNRVMARKTSLKSKKSRPSVKQKSFKRKKTDFIQDTIRKFALKYGIGANTISGIRKDKEKLKAFLTSCEVSVDCVAVKWLIGSTNEVTIISEQEDSSTEIQGFGKYSANFELLCKGVEERSSQSSRKRKKSESGEEAATKKKGARHSVGPKFCSSESEDKNELVSFLSPCVVHKKQDFDPSSPTDDSLESQKQSPLKASCAESPEQSPVKASAKSPKQRPVKASSAKSREQSPVKASSATLPRQSPVTVSSAESPEQSLVTDSSSESPKQTPVKAGVEKSFEQSPVKASSTKSPKQRPVKDSSVKSRKQSPVKTSSATPRQSPVTGSSAESPEQSLVTASSAESPKQTPVKTSYAKSPKQRPVKASAATSPRQSPAAANREKLPEQTPVTANSAKLSKQSPVKAGSVKSSEQTPVKTSNERSPKQCPVKTKSAELHEQSPVEADCVKSPEQSPLNASSAESCRQSTTKASSARSSEQSPVKASGSKSPKQSLVKVSTGSMKSPKQNPVQPSEAEEVVRECQTGKSSDADTKVQHNDMEDHGETEASEFCLTKPSEGETRTTEQNENSSRATELVGMNTSVTGQIEIDKTSEQIVDNVGAGSIATGTAVAKQIEIDAENSQKSTSQTEVCYDEAKQVMGTQNPVERQLAETPKRKSLVKSEVTVDKLAEDYGINHATVRDISSDSEKLEAFLSPCFVSIKRESKRDSQNVTEPPSSITMLATPEPVSQKQTFKSPSGIIKASLGSDKKGKGKGKLIVKFKFF